MSPRRRIARIRATLRACPEGRLYKLGRGHATILDTYDRLGSIRPASAQGIQSSLVHDFRVNNDRAVVTNETLGVR